MSVLLFEDFTKLYKRWSNGDVRKEDGVNSMSKSDFTAYIDSKYKFRNSANGHVCKEDYFGSIVTSLWKSTNGGYKTNLELDNYGKIKFFPNALQFLDLFPKLKEVLNSKYIIKSDIYILPKEGDVTNEFYIDVINTVIDTLGDDSLIMIV